MKKAIGCIVLVSMLCISMSGAGFSKTVNYENENDFEKIQTSSYTTIQECTTALQQNVNQYFSMDANRFAPNLKQDEPIVLPWGAVNTADFLQWVVRIEYNHQIFEKEVHVDISDFSEKFLKHPEYGEILYFNVDSDPEDDLEAIVGFYWSAVKYPDGDSAKGLELRYRVRQMPGGGVADNTAEMEVWSQLRVNYGLLTGSGRSKSLDRNIPDSLIGNIVKKFFVKFQDTRFPILNKFVNKILERYEMQDEDSGDNIETLDANSDSDYIVMGTGYRSPDGMTIPKLVEKRFSFAKGFNYNWRKEGNIFNPTIFEQELYETTSDDPVTLLYGFQAYDSADTKKFDIAFSTEFNPPVYVKIKYIPTDAYLYYFFDSKSNKGGQVDITFSADAILGQAYDMPELVLTFDKIDSTLAQSGRWFGIDIDASIFGAGDLIGFHYKASNTFDVGIKVNVPSLFEEKVKIQGVPTSVDIGFDVSVDLTVLPKVIDVSFGGKLKLDMSSDIDRVTVYYPKSNPDDADEVFLDVQEVPKSETLTAEASLYLDTVGGRLHVKPSGSVGMQMSSSIGEINVYYPKAVSGNPDAKFLYVPSGSIPNRAEIGGEIEVYLLDPQTLTNSNNFIAGNIYHDCNKNVDEVDFYLPDNQETPIIKMTDMPADSYAEARLYWNQLSGHAYGTRGYVGGRDPIELNLEYGGFEIYNKLEIEQGFITTSFKIAQDGYLNFDTSRNMFKNTLRVKDNNPNSNLNQIYLQVEDLSADDLHADWDVSGSGDQLKINSLHFRGIVDTIRDFHIDVTLSGKSTQLDLDWVLGKTGKVEVDLYQDEPVHVDFDLDGQIAEGLDLHGSVTLPSNPHFDCSWKWHQGERYTDPGYFKINENTHEVSIENLHLYVDYMDTWGAEIDCSNIGIYACVEWYWYNLLLYIWPVIDITGSIDLNLLLNGQWYDAIDYENPPG